MSVCSALASLLPENWEAVLYHVRQMQRSWISETPIYVIWRQIKFDARAEEEQLSYMCPSFTSQWRLALPQRRNRVLDRRNSWCDGELQVCRVMVTSYLHLAPNLEIVTTKSYSWLGLSHSAATIVKLCQLLESLHVVDVMPTHTGRLTTFATCYTSKICRGVLRHINHLHIWIHHLTPCRLLWELKSRSLKMPTETTLTPILLCL